MFCSQEFFCVCRGRHSVVAPFSTEIFKMNLSSDSTNKSQPEVVGPAPIGQGGSFTSQPLKCDSVSFK